MTWPFLSIGQDVSLVQSPTQTTLKRYGPYHSARPFTRWWWFAGPIDTLDIAFQLDWVKKQGFGGVEIAWVYPLYKYNNWMKPKYDTIQTRPEWLSPAWQSVSGYAKRYAESIGLHCDFTFGTSWPEGDSQVSWADRTQVYGDSNFKQTLSFSWEFPKIGLVFDHMNKGAYQRFARRYFNALRSTQTDKPSGILCESWEIKLNGKLKLWTPGFAQRFERMKGYNILPYMPKLDSFPDVRYDYMQVVGDYVNRGFYQPFARSCRQEGYWSRAECLGAPTDVMTTYSLVDVPETEAMLNEPNFAKIVTSAAALSGKPVVSCESFTCMYGFPRTLHQQEQTADLKMVADALFAQGVNQIVWHGMPYNPMYCDTQYFFATVHVGQRGSLAPDLAEFNQYMQRVSQYMRIGKPYSEVAVYVPFEDAVMKGPLPVERQRVWVWGEYELRYIKIPSFLKGYAPLWINGHFLTQSKFRHGRLLCGDAQFKYLWVDVEYIDARALRHLLRLGRKGLPMVLKQLPKQPGAHKSARYRKIVARLSRLPNVYRNWEELKASPPLLSATDTMPLPDFWCRIDNHQLYLFLANPRSMGLQYPIYSGQSFQAEPIAQGLHLRWNGIEQRIPALFNPYQSILYRLDAGGFLDEIDIEYSPPAPIVRPRTKEKMNF